MAGVCSLGVYEVEIEELYKGRGWMAACLKKEFLTTQRFPPQMYRPLKHSLDRICLL